VPKKDRTTVPTQDGNRAAARPDLGTSLGSDGGRIAEAPRLGSPDLGAAGEEGGSNNETPATYEQTTGSGGGSPTAPKGWAKQSIWSAWERIKEVEPTMKVQKVRRKKEVRKMRKIREKKRKQKLFYYVFSYKIILL